MEIVTSWERKGIKKGIQETQEEIANNLLREGFAVEFVVKVTGLNVERVQQLQVQLESEN